MSTSTAASTAARDVSTCLLVGDDVDAALSTVEAVRALGAVVVAVPQSLAARVLEALGAPHAGEVTTVVEIPPAAGVGDAWNLALQAAPTDVCLLLHAGEVLVAGRPGPGEVFTAATVVEQTEPLTPPERLGNVRVVDRRRCRFTGMLRSGLEVALDQPDGAPLAAGHGSTVIVDLGAWIGPEYAAWLQFAARHLDATHDPAELVDLAAMLAATGEADGAAARLLTVHGALDGDLGRRAARLLCVLGQRHARIHEVELAVQEWRRLSAGRPGAPPASASSSTPGPALALHGLTLLSAQRPGEAATQLAAALEAGLVDEDGVGIDRGWVRSALFDARAASQRSASVLPRVFAEIDVVLETTQATNALIDLWIQAGPALSQMLEKVTGRRRRLLAAACLQRAALLGSRSCIDLAQFLWRGDQETATLLVHVAASCGGLGVADALVWSRRLRSTHGAAACPLPLLAAGVATPAVTRVLAAAALIHDLNDDRGKALLQAAAIDLHPAAMDGAMRRLHGQAPDLEKLLAHV